MPDNQNASNQASNGAEIEVIKIDPQDIKDLKNDDAIVLEPSKLDIKRGGNIIIGTLNIIAAPAKKRWSKYYHKQNPRRHWHLLIDALLAAIILALIIFNAYLQLQPLLNVNNKIDIKISTEPAKIISGDTVAFIIDYGNLSKTKLKESNLTLRLPKGLSLLKAEPANLFAGQSNTFVLGDIEPGANGRIKLSGKMLGSIGEKQLLEANLNYTPAGSETRQIKTVAYAVNIEGSRISLSIAAPDKISNGQIFDLAVDYQNSSENDIGQLIIKPDFASANFKLEDSSLPLADGQWIIKGIKAGAKEQLKATGRFLAPEKSNKMLINMGAYLPFGNSELLQAQARQEVEIIYPKIALEIKPRAEYAIPGQNVPFVITYKNNEEFAIENPAIKAVFDGGLTQAKEIVWTRRQIPALAKIAPGQSGEIKFNARLKDKFSQTSALQKNYLLSGRAEAFYALPAQAGVELYKSSAEASLKIATDLTLSAFARYYSPEGEQMGRGPVPPIAGQATKYWIFLSINNSYNDAKDIAISASLPANVKFTNKTSVTAGDDIVFDQANRKISWRLDSAPAPTQFFPSLGAAFEVEIIPSQAQASQPATLIDDIAISGTDQFIGEKISNKLGNITTNLIIDERETSGGKVKSK